MRLVAVVIGAALMGCASFDPGVPTRLPDADWAVGASLGVTWDEAKDPLRGGGLVGVDASFLEDVFGLHAGLRLQREGRGTRLSGLVEATAWYLVLFGVGARVGGLVADAGEDIPERTAELTFLFALPIPVWRDCLERRGALVVMPYARPGLRFLGGREDRIRGVHELGISLRWTSFSF